MWTNINILWEAPGFLVDLLANGLLIGSIFALAAFGMALVWGVMNIINIVQGEYVMLGGFVTYYLAQAGISPLFGVPVAAIALFIVGWGMYRVVIHRVVDKDMFISILATFGLSILFQQLTNELFGSDVRTAEAGLDTLQFLDGMVSISEIKLLAFVLTLTIGLTLWLFLKRSRLGQAIRATAQNPRAARILGIDTDRVFAATYSLNAALCGAAGALVVMAWTIHPYIGLPYTVRSFMIVVTAGLGNIGGVVVAGLGLGALENLAGFVLGAEFQIAFVFTLMVVILVLRNLLLRRQRKYLK